MNVQKISVVRTLVAILGGVLFLIGAVGIISLVHSMYEGKYQWNENSAFIKQALCIAAYPSAIACFCYVSEIKNLKHSIIFASILPFGVIAISVLFIAALEKTGITSGKDSIVGLVPAFIVCLLLTRLVNAWLCQKNA